MRIVGVDLAWGPRNPSGLCAIEGHRVIDSATVTSDEEIARWIARHATTPVLVAFDAPLIVKNPTGCRGAERVIGKVWGGAHASCYPANLGRPWLRDGGRASRLARRLGLGTNPATIGTPSTRLAIEVYPHTGLVSLFHLPRSLKYKAARRRIDGHVRSRTVAERQHEFRRLLNHLVSLRDARAPLDVTAAPRWADLVRAIDMAKRGADLDRVEDEVDAFVCAYIGLHYTACHATGASVVIGDTEHGYIVTPIDEPRQRAVREASDDYGVTVA